VARSNIPVQTTTAAGAHPKLASSGGAGLSGASMAGASLAPVSVEETVPESQSREALRSSSPFLDIRDVPGSISQVLELRRHLRALQETPSSLEANHLLSRALDIAEGLATIAEASAANETSGPALVRLAIGPGASWFRVDGQERISLRRRRALPGILLAFAAAGAHRPLPLEAIVAAGWPDERVLRKAAELRVRSAISTLRRLGLRGLLVTTGSGYVLDAQVVGDLVLE
jgi:hypothetical protein